jgi:hypothetical protein
MSQTDAFPNVSRPPSEPDLSEEICLSIAKESGERVTCRRISGDKYRCNWWAPKRSAKYDNPRMAGMMVTTHVVAKSRFVSATRSPQGLVIRDAPTGASE